MKLSRPIRAALASGRCRTLSTARALLARGWIERLPEMTEPDHVREHGENWAPVVWTPEGLEARAKIKPLPPTPAALGPARGVVSEALVTRRRRTDPIDGPPTSRQQQALDLVVQGIRAGRPPTIRELGAAMGIRSTYGVVCLLRPLVRKGYLTHDPDSPARLSYRLTERRPPLSVAWLVDQAEQLLAAIDQHYGRAELVSDLACATPWWRLVVRTGGWGENEAAIQAVDPTWHGLTLQAQVRGGLWVWAWGPVPEQLGGELGPVRVET